MSTERQDYRLAAILVAAVQGYEALARSEGDEAAKRVQFARAMIERQAQEWAGSIVPSSSSQIVVEFASASGAVQAALQVQSTLSREARNGVNLRLRMGIHSGDVWFIRGDVIGEGVEIASRLQSLATAGGICMSETVYNQIKDEVSLPHVTDLGVAELTDLNRRVHAVEVAPGKGDGPASDQRGGGGESLSARIMGRAHSGGRRLSAGGLADLLAGGQGRITPILESLADRGLLTRIKTADGRTEYGVAYHQSDVDETAPGFRSDEAEEEREFAKRTGMRVHALAFVVANLLFFALWFMTTPLGFPWFLFPLGGWTIGLASHYVAWLVNRRHRREQRARLTRDQRRALKGVQRGEKAWAAHLTAYATTNAYLLMINTVTSPQFPWFLFPAAGWGVGLASHRMVYTMRRQSLLKRLGRLGVDLEMLQETPGAPDTTDSRYQRLIDEASQVRDSIVQQLERSEQVKLRWGDELMPLLDQYLRQIAALNQQSGDLDRLLGRESGGAITDEIAAMRARRERTPSALVRAEYDRSIVQAEQQKKSLDELRGQKEILDLRLKSAVIALKKLEMDFARMRGLETSGEQFAMNALREKSDELSRYLEDLRSSYSEIDS